MVGLGHLAPSRAGWHLQPMTLPTGILIVAALSLAPALQVQSQSAASDSTRRETSALVGIVVDVVGQPMEDAEVYIPATDRTTRSDARGFWRFTDAPTGARVVVARRPGYVPFVREVMVGNHRDTLTLVLRRFPARLARVEINERASSAQADALTVAERLAHIRVGSGRLFTREDILRTRPASIAHLIYGIPGINVVRTQTAITATTSRSGVGVQNFEGKACELQFYLDNTPISNEALPALDPLTFRSVEVYPQTVMLTGLSMRSDRCGAVVINTLRR
jgi:hypothetical protein